MVSMEEGEARPSAGHQLPFYFAHDTPPNTLKKPVNSIGNPASSKQQHPKQIQRARNSFEILIRNPPRERLQGSSFLAEDTLSGKSDVRSDDLSFSSTSAINPTPVAPPSTEFYADLYQYYYDNEEVRDSLLAPSILQTPPPPMRSKSSSSSFRIPSPIPSSPSSPTTPTSARTRERNMTANTPPRCSPPPDFLIDDDPFANLTSAPSFSSSSACASSSSPSSPPGVRSLSISSPTNFKRVVPPLPRSHLHGNDKHSPKVASPILPSASLSPTKSSLSPPSSPSQVPPRILSGGRPQVQPAHQRPAFKSRPSLPSLNSLAGMNVVLTKKVRKGRVGAGLPFEPWDLPSDEEFPTPTRASAPTTAINASTFPSTSTPTSPTFPSRSHPATPNTQQALRSPPTSPTFPPSPHHPQYPLSPARSLPSSPRSHYTPLLYQQQHHHNRQRSQSPVLLPSQIVALGSILPDLDLPSSLSTEPKRATTTGELEVENSTASGSSSDSTWPDASLDPKKEQKTTTTTGEFEVENSTLTAVPASGSSSDSTWLDASLDLPPQDKYTPQPLPEDSDGDEYLSDLLDNYQEADEDARENDEETKEQEDDARTPCLESQVSPELPITSIPLDSDAWNSNSAISPSSSLATPPTSFTSSLSPSYSHSSLDSLEALLVNDEPEAEPEPEEATQPLLNGGGYGDAIFGFGFGFGFRKRASSRTRTRTRESLSSLELELDGEREGEESQLEKSSSTDARTSTRSSTDSSSSIGHPSLSESRTRSSTSDASDGLSSFGSPNSPHGFVPYAYSHAAWLQARKEAFKDKVKVNVGGEESATNSGSLQAPSAYGAEEDACLSTSGISSCLHQHQIPHHQLSLLHHHLDDSEMNNIPLQGLHADDGVDDWEFHQRPLSSLDGEEDGAGDPRFPGHFDCSDEEREDDDDDGEVDGKVKLAEAAAAAEEAEAARNEMVMRRDSNSKACLALNTSMNNTSASEGEGESEGSSDSGLRPRPRIRRSSTATPTNYHNHKDYYFHHYNYSDGTCATKEWVPTETATDTDTDTKAARLSPDWDDDGRVTPALSFGAVRPSASASALELERDRDSRDASFLGSRDSYINQPSAVLVAISTTTTTTTTTTDPRTIITKDPDMLMEPLRISVSKSPSLSTSPNNNTTTPLPSGDDMGGRRRKGSNSSSDVNTEYYYSTYKNPTATTYYASANKMGPSYSGMSSIDVSYDDGYRGASRGRRWGAGGEEEGVEEEEEDERRRRRRAVERGHAVESGRVMTKIVASSSEEEGDEEETTRLLPVVVPNATATTTVSRSLARPQPQYSTSASPSSRSRSPSNLVSVSVSTTGMTRPNRAEAARPSASSRSRSPITLPSSSTSPQQPMHFPTTPKSNTSSQYTSEADDDDDNDDDEDEDDEDDDVPLAQRIPGALTAQKTMRRRFREERLRRKEREAEERARQLTLRPAGAGSALLVDGGGVVGSSSHDAAVAAAALAAATATATSTSQPFARQRTMTLPGKNNNNGRHASHASSSSAFNPLDLARKLQNVQMAEMAGASPHYQQQQQGVHPAHSRSPSHLRSRSKSISRTSNDQARPPVDVNHAPPLPSSSAPPVSNAAGVSSSTNSRTRSIKDHNSTSISSSQLRQMRSFHHTSSSSTRRPSVQDEHRPSGGDAAEGGGGGRLARSARPSQDGGTPHRRNPSQSSRPSTDRQPMMIPDAPVPQLPPNLNLVVASRTSSDEQRKFLKSQASTSALMMRSSRPSMDVERPPPRTSTSHSQQQPLPLANVLSKNIVTQQRVFVGNLQQFNMVEIGPSTTAGDVIAMIENEGALVGWAGSGGWMVFEIAQDFGMERPVRSYELLADVQASWLKDKTVNFFVLKLTPLAVPLSRNNIPSKSPTHSGYVEWEVKRGKWSKRWLNLREHSLWLSKRDNGKDEIQLCSLSNFDAYQITRANRAPKPFAFAIKSTDNLSFFEDTADYMHSFSCQEKDGVVWLEKILVARSYVLHQERHVLFNPKPSSSSTSGPPTSSGPSTSSSNPLARSATRKASSARPAHAQPLISVPPPHFGAQIPHHDVFEPGSLLAKQH